MTTIKCEVVKDLLPLYVDNVLSDESRILVEEHLDTCSECRGYYEKLREKSVPLIRKDDENWKEAVKKIRKKISTKRIRAICLTAILVAAIASGLFYGIVVKQSYLPYEKTGLYVENGAIHTNEPYYCYYGFDSPEEGTIFIYMTTTLYESHSQQQEKITVDKLFDEVIPADDENNENEYADDSAIKQVFYVPREYVKLLQDGYWSSGETETDYITENQERLDELKEASVPVYQVDNVNY